MRTFRSSDVDSIVELLASCLCAEAIDKAKFTRQVAASERGKGIAHALMFRTLQSQPKAGHETSFFMWSDDKTAERLYHSAGFKEKRRFAVLKKEI